MATRALLFVALLCWSDSFFSVAATDDDVKVYDVKVDDEIVAKIKTKTYFVLGDETVPLPSSAAVTGLENGHSFIVRFNWETGIFEMHFKEEDKTAYLVEASASISGKNATWKLGYNLRDSNSSYQCSAFYSVSNDGEAKLVMLRNRFQVFNLHGDFSDPIVCPEDGTDMIRGEWSLNTTDGIPCIRLQGAMAFNISYVTLEGRHATAKINLPATAAVVPEDSHCFKSGTTVNTTTEQTITLGFYDDWRLTLHFTRDANITKDNRNDHWLVDWVELQFQYDNQHFPSTKHPGTKREDKKNEVDAHGDGSLNLFRTMKDRSYSCNALIETNVADNFTLLTERVQAQAFMYEEKYFPMETCAADLMTSDLVPIIIGAALAILIVVVLIAYLVGRARTRRQTYENI